MSDGADAVVRIIRFCLHVGGKMLISVASPIKAPLVFFRR